MYSYGNKADENFIRTKMFAWMKDDNDRRGFFKMLWETLHELNGGGRTLRYLYFNERAQRVYIDRDFEPWAKELSKELEKALPHFN